MKKFKPQMYEYNDKRRERRFIFLSGEISIYLRPAKALTITPLNLHTIRFL